MQASEPNFIAVYAAAVSAVAALIGVAVASIFAIKTARLNHREQRAHRMDERQLDRLEELHILFERWEMNLSQVYLFHLRYFKGSLSFSDVLALVKDLQVMEKGDFQRMNMILSLYAGSLSQQYQEVQDARKRLVPFLAESAPSSHSIEDFIEAQIHFETIASSFKNAIAQLVKSTLLNQRASKSSSIEY